MDNLFTKAVIIPDAHFGRSGNSQVANQDNLDTLDWAIDRARSWGADTAICLGDWHDHRLGVQTNTLHASLDGMDKLNKAFKKVYWILGNHDVMKRESRAEHSLTIGRHYTNFQTITEPVVINGCCFLPWLVKDEYKKVGKLKSKYTFAHLELPGFLMNAQVVAPDHPQGIHAEDFSNHGTVFSGHFHSRQMGAGKHNNIIYTGSLLPFSFSDANDSDRGIMLLEWGKDPIFEAWPDQPLYRNLRLSALLDRPQSLLRPKMSIKVTQDLDLDPEVIDQLRDALVNDYGLRRVEFMPVTVAGDVEAVIGDDVEFKSVDQMMIEGLQNVQSETIDVDVLLAEYEACRS